MADYILIIDDDDDMRDLLSQAAQTLGLPIRLARGGKEALGLIRQGTPALILLDLCMPDVTGWDFLEIIRNDPRQVEMPIIAVTSMPVSRRLAASLRLPMRHILPKHVAISRLPELFADLVGAPTHHNRHFK